MTDEERLYDDFEERLWPAAEAIMKGGIHVRTAVDELLGFTDTGGVVSKAFFFHEANRTLEGMTADQFASIRAGDLLLGAWVAGWRPDGWNEN